MAEGGVSFGSILESLNLLTFVLPGNVIAAASKVTCVVGKSMAVKREALERIGGFSAFSNVLAEDQAMALAIKTAGYRVLLSSTIVRNISVRKTLGQVLSRQGRWGKMRYAFSKKMFVIEFLANPLPLAILACATGAASGVDRWTAASLPAAVVVVRVLQAGALSLIVGSGLNWRPMLAPVQDAFQFAVQFIPFFSREITWRAHRARLGPGTLLLPPRPKAGETAQSQLEGTAHDGVASLKRHWSHST